MNITLKGKFLTRHNNPVVPFFVPSISTSNFYG